MHRRLDAFRIAQHHSRSTDVRLVRALLSRPGVAIAGRDGTLVQSGGTGATALHPTTGAVVSAGALISHNLNLPGVGVLPMTFAQGARTNLCLGLVTNGGVATNVLTGLNRVATEDTSTGLHTISKSLCNLTAGTAYRLRFSARRVVGTRHIVVYAASTARAGLALNLETGATLDYVTGGGAISNIVVTDRPGGWFDVRCDISSSASWAGSVSVVVGINNVFQVGNTSHAGDGSAIEISAVTIEAAAFSGLGLAEGATRAADNILWTPPAALSTVSGEVVAIAAPYLWGAGAGVAGPMVGSAVRWANGNNYNLRTANDVAGRADAGTQSASASALAESSGALRQLSTHWATGALSLYRGDVRAAQDLAVSAPWASVANLGVAHSAGANQWFGFVGLIYVPGGLTDAERSALARLTAGRLSYVG
jgi:hypothetical protein